MLADLFAHTPLTERHIVQIEAGHHGDVAETQSSGATARTPISCFESPIVSTLLRSR